MVRVEKMITIEGRHYRVEKNMRVGNESPKKYKNKKRKENSGYHFPLPIFFSITNQGRQKNIIRFYYEDDDRKR